MTAAVGKRRPPLLTVAGVKRCGTLQLLVMGGMVQHLLRMLLLTQPNATAASTGGEVVPPILGSCHGDGAGSTGGGGIRDSKHRTDAQEHAPQNRPQLRFQIDTGQIAQEHVVAGDVGRKPCI